VKGQNEGSKIRSFSSLGKEESAGLTEGRGAADWSADEDDEGEDEEPNSFAHIAYDEKHDEVMPKAPLHQGQPPVSEESSD
jgi:hypothetical protein